MAKEKAVKIMADAGNADAIKADPVKVEPVKVESLFAEVRKNGVTIAYPKAEAERLVREEGWIYV